MTHSRTFETLIARKKRARRADPSDERMPESEPDRAPVTAGAGVSTPANVAALQRLAGNRAAQRVLFRTPLAQPIQREGGNDEEKQNGNEQTDDKDTDSNDIDEETVDYDDPNDADGNDLTNVNEEDDDTGGGGVENLVDDEGDGNLDETSGDENNDEIDDSDLDDLEQDEDPIEDDKSEDTETNDTEDLDTSQGLGENAPEGTGLTGGNLQLGGNVQSAPNKAKYRRNKSDKLKDQDYKYGAYQGYRSGKRIYGSTTSIIDNSDTAGSVRALTTQEYAGQFSNAANNVATAASSGSLFALQTAMSGFVGEFMPYIKLIKLAIKIPKAIVKTNRVRGHLSALNKAAKSSKEKAAAGDQIAQQVYEASKYGIGKVRRQFAERIAKIIIAIVKFATIITELVTGGTAILFTSIGRLLTGVSKGIISGIAAIKSLYKSFKGTKGVNRRKNAEVLIDGANAGNVEALHLLYKLKVGKAVWMKQNNLQRSRNPFAKEIKFFSKDEAGYRTWLMGLSSKDWGKLRRETAKRLRSTSMKTFTEKRRSAGI